MQNLYWKSRQTSRTLISSSFDNEAAFEKYVFDNQDLLGDVFIIHRQIRTGSKQGIPDMLGVDKNARVCIIEMKNEEAKEDVLPQVLSYAIWAETNPDSIKAIWLESKNTPDEIEIDWDGFEVRILIIAPSFRPTVRRMAGKIGYQIDLVQMQRFCFDDDEFLLVEFLKEQEPPNGTTTKVQQDWDWGYYEEEHGKSATDQFRQAVEKIAKLANEHGWKLPHNLNKYYTGFKLGNRVVFNVAWGGTHAWQVRFKIPEEMAKAFQCASWEFQRYDAQFKEAIFRPLDRAAAKIAELEPLFVAAYQHASGSR